MVINLNAFGLIPIHKDELKVQNNSGDFGIE